MKQGSENALEQHQLLPAQHSAALAALQLWEKTWEEAMQRVAVMADCLQSVATCLGIDKHVKSALSSENGVAEVQSITAIVMDAVTTLRGKQHSEDPASCWQRNAYQPAEAVKLEHRDEHHLDRDICHPHTFCLAPVPEDNFVHQTFPTASVPLPVKCPSQMVADRPLSRHAAHKDTSIPVGTDISDEAKGAINHDAQHVCDLGLQQHAGGNAGQAAGEPRIQASMFSRPPDGQDVQRQPLRVPAGNMACAVHAQVQYCRSPEDKKLGQGGEGDQIVDVGETTPPRPLALLRETCIATPISQRPPDAFGICAHSQLKGSPSVLTGKQSHIDRYGIAHAVEHNDRPQRFGAAAFAVNAEHAVPANGQGGVRVRGVATKLNFRDEAVLGGCAVPQQPSAAKRDGDTAVHQDSSAGYARQLGVRQLQSDCAAPVNSFAGDAGSAGASDAATADLPDTHFQADEEEGMKEVCWRVLGAKVRSQREQPAASAICGQAASSEPYDMQQQPPRMACAPNHDHKTVSLANAGHVQAAQEQGGQLREARPQPGDSLQHGQLNAHATSVPAHTPLQDSECSAQMCSGAPVDRVGLLDAPAARGDAFRGTASGAGDAAKGKRKAGGVWKPRKANILARKPSQQAQGKSSGRIDRMLSHINVPRSQGTKRAAVSGERHLHGPVSVAPVAAKALASINGEENLEQRRLDVHAEQTAVQHQGGPRVYDERVRKRAERETLPAWECQGCARFYAMLKQQGYKVDNDVLKCSDCGDDRENGQAILQETSRHRHRFVAPPTPKNFWAIGFDDDWMGNGNRRDAQC